MKAYNDLVDDIAKLHSQNQPSSAFVPSPSTLANQWIPTVVDAATSRTNIKLPVIVAFGANYATGQGKMPAPTSKQRRSAPPWVEDDLGRNRLRAISFLKACGDGRVRKHWNGLLPYDPDERYHISIASALDPEPHFVMTNLSPWITNRDWSKIRDDSFEDLLALLGSHGMRSGGLWAYFRHIKGCVGSDAIWLGHGNADVFGFFRLLCWQLNVRTWFFDSNLSQKSLMIAQSAS